MLSIIIINRIPVPDLFYLEDRIYIFEDKKIIKVGNKEFKPNDFYELFDSYEKTFPSFYEINKSYIDCIKEIFDKQNKYGKN